MDIWHAIILAIVQGLTEFLPISSSAHLILVPVLLGWQDQGLAFDVAVHVGTLTAVLSYFRKEVVEITVDWTCALRTGQQTRNSYLGWWVIIGTIPVGLAGIVFKGFIESNLRSALVIATTTILFGLLLWFADRKTSNRKDEYSMNIRDVLVVGCAQVLALIPGTSRSGITITAGLLLGLNRTAAARFSFLLSIPAILLPGGLHVLELVTSATAVDSTALIVGILMSALSAYACIHFFLLLLERVGMWPFVVYRMLLGVVLFALFV